jgi:hypothetical protein
MSDYEIFALVIIGVVAATEVATVFMLIRLPGWMSPTLVRVVNRRTSSKTIM